MSDAPAVRAEKLSRRFGHRLAVSGVDLEIRRGDFVGLFGPNGAGKTTLLRLLCGLLRPSSGEIRLLGRSIREDAAGARSRLGYLAHASFLYRGLSARENLGFYARLYSVAEPAARIAELLERVGLASRAADPVRTFSRGMLQRLSIARALLHRPEILFLDEPFTGLDREASGILSGLLDETRARQGTVVMVTHDLGRGLGFAGRLLLLSRGRIVDDRPAAGVTASDLEALYASRVKGWVS